MMDNQAIVARWQTKIVDVCEEKLQRPLSENERDFVCCRAGFVVLEMIEDTISGMSASELMFYLNSEIVK